MILYDMGEIGFRNVLCRRLWNRKGKISEKPLNERKLRDYRTKTGKFI